MGTINDRIKRIVNELFNGNTSSFARQINVPQPTLKDIVGGKLSTPRADVLEKIFGDKSLNISAEWLLGGEGEMIKNISESDSQNDIQLPEVPEANKSETETIKSLLSVISDQANILKQVTNSKEQKHIEEQKEMFNKIESLPKSLDNQGKYLQTLCKKIDDLISENNIPGQKKVG